MRVCIIVKFGDINITSENQGLAKECVVSQSL
jgi:hypothetical protein